MSNVKHSAIQPSPFGVFQMWPRIPRVFIVKFHVHPFMANNLWIHVGKKLQCKLGFRFPEWF